MKLTKNFHSEEFICPCCGQDHIFRGLVDKLQTLRGMIGKPIHISSGYRCKKYNEKIKGYKFSPHIEGLAADIVVKDFDFIELAIMAYDIGFKRIGFYPLSQSKFLHLDLVPPSPSEAWIRGKNGQYKYYRTLKRAIKEVKK